MSESFSVLYCVPTLSLALHHTDLVFFQGQYDLQAQLKTLFLQCLLKKFRLNKLSCF